MCKGTLFVVVVCHLLNDTSLCRFGAELTYYGISLNIAGFGLSLFLTQFIFASMEVPMKICVYFFTDKLGRKPSEMGALFLTALFLFINMFIPKGLFAVSVIMCLKRAFYWF